MTTDALREALKLTKEGGAAVVAAVAALQISKARRWHSAPHAACSRLSRRPRKGLALAHWRRAVWRASLLPSFKLNFAYLYFLRSARYVITV